MPKKIKILLLDDNPYDAELIMHEIKRQGVACECTHVQDREHFILALEKEPDIILADYSLPQFNASQAIRLVKESGATTPVIVISGTIGEEVAVEMMRQGAADYLMKDRLARLSGAIQFAIEAAELRKTYDRYLHELEESTARYRSLFEDSPISLWEEDFSRIKAQLDHMQSNGVEDLNHYFSGNKDRIFELAQLRIVKAINAATLTLYQAEHEEKAAELLGALFTDESLELFWAELYHLYQGNTTYHVNARHFTLDRKVIHVSLSVAIAPGYEQTWGKIFNSIIDVTELSQAQQQIAESEALLRTVIDSSPDSIMVKDKDFHVLLANQAIADTVNTTPEAMIGRTEDEIGYPLDWVYGNPEKGINGFRATDHEVLQEGKETREMVPFPVNGETHYFEVFKKPLRNPAGEITSELVYSRDITEIVKTQNELEQSEELLRSVFDSSSDWIFVKDKAHQYILVNKQFLDGLGLKMNEVIGKTDQEVGFPAERARRFQADDDRIMATGEPILFDDVNILTQTGEPRHFSTMKSPLYNAEGEVWGIMGIARDITERLERNQQLAESRRNYEVLFDSLADGMLIHQLDGTILVVNSVADQTFGYQPGDSILNYVSSLDATDEPKTLYEARLEKLRQSGHISYFAPHTRLDGTSIVLEINSNLVKFQGEDAILSIMRDISDVLEAQSALRESEEQYRELFDIVPDIIILLSESGEIVHMNQTICTLSGYSYEKLQGMQITDLLKSSSNRLNPINLTPNTGESTITLELLTAQNEKRLLDFTSIRTTFGGSPVIMLVGRDQTERIMAERKTQETEGLLRTMIDIIPQPIFVYDEDGTYVMVNNNLAELFQTDKEYLLGKTNADLAQEGILNPHEAAIYHENAMIPLMTREPFFRPIDTYKDADGIQHWFQIYTTPFKMPDNSTRVVGVGNEITQQMQARSRLEAMNEALENRVEERTRDLDRANLELLKAKEQLESILQYSPDGFLLLDANLNIQVMNPAFSNIIGIRPEENVGKNVLLAVSEMNKTLINDSIQKAIQQKEPINVEHTATHLDESSFDCLTSISPIFSEDILVGVVIGVHDITPQKEVQRMKDAFVSNVSHELRTPITNFICNLELIRMNPKKQDVYLERLDQEIVQLRNIIEDLLRLSRFDQDSSSILQLPIDINEVCSDFTSLRTPLADQKNISLTFYPHPELPPVLGEKSLVTQVLSILVTNAINYTPPEGEIVIRTHPADQDHPGMAAFSVHDTGAGISPREQTKVFDRFYRGEAGLESNVSGTGLGLPIAQEIIQRHSGLIEVSSSGIAGEGSTFTVWLPAAPQE